MSEKKRFYWLKLKDDFFSDKRIKKLRRIAGGDTYTVIYLKMQLASLQNNGVIIYEGVEPSFAEEIALVIDEDVENVKVTIAFLQENGLLVEYKENEFALPETQELIGTETNWAMQKRIQRKVDNVHQLSTNCPRDIDIDIEIDKDKDKEIELKKENNKEKDVKNIIPPKIEWVEEYCRERNNNIDPQTFIDFYEGKGWMIGKNKMKDWKASIRTWERNIKNNSRKESILDIDTNILPETPDDEFPF